VRRISCNRVCSFYFSVSLYACHYVDPTLRIPASVKCNCSLVGGVWIVFEITVYRDSGEAPCTEQYSEDCRTITFPALEFGIYGGGGSQYVVLIKSFALAFRVYGGGGCCTRVWSGLL
jgi:hypothetical protein